MRRSKTEESQRATETTRAYLESVLGNLSSGVLAFDDRYRLRTANPSAAVHPAAAVRRAVGHAARRMGRTAAGARAVQRARRRRFSRVRATGSGSARRRSTVAGQTRTLLLRGTRLPGAPVPGYVVVFDDVSELLQAQRDAAWARGRAPPRARDQESADADPALRRAACGQARAAARRQRPGNACAAARRRSCRRWRR